VGRQEISACSVEILSFAGGDMDRPLDTESADQSSSQCFGLSLKVRLQPDMSFIPMTMPLMLLTSTRRICAGQGHTTMACDHVSQC